jgi:hypothetical protein
VPLPHGVKDPMVRKSALVRERLLEYWYKETCFPFRYQIMNKHLAMYGYQGQRLMLDPTMQTKINRILDPVDTTVAMYKYGHEPWLSFYGTAVRLTGAEIHRLFLGEKKPITLASNEKTKKNIVDSLEYDYEVVYALDDENIYVIVNDTQELLDVIEHKRGFVPAIMWQNIPQYDSCEGIADGAHVLGKNEFINVLLRYAMDYLQYQSDPIIIATGLSADTDIEDVLKNRRGYVQGEQGAEVKFVAYPAMNDDFVRVINMLNQAITDETAINEMATSGRTDNRRVDSGSAIASLSAGLEVHLNLKREMFIQYNDIMNEMYLRWIDEVYRPELFGGRATLQIGGMFDDDTFQCSGMDINGKYVTQTEFTGQFDMMAYHSMVIQDLEAGLIPKREARRKLRYRHPETMEEMIRAEKMEDIRFMQMTSIAEKSGDMMANGQQMPSIGGGAQPPQIGPGQAMLPQPTPGPPANEEMPSGLIPAPPTGEMQPESISPVMQSADIGMKSEEVAARIAQLKGLKGEVEFAGVRDGMIILYITNPEDKATILNQLPEYKGLITFVVYNADQDIAQNMGIPTGMQMPPEGGMPQMEGGMPQMEGEMPQMT